MRKPHRLQMVSLSLFAPPRNEGKYLKSKSFAQCMCGIIGCVGFPLEIDEDICKKATTLLEHRGPDDEGFYFDNHCFLGHKRYSVIDLSRNAKQPISNEDESLFLICNGECYNYKKIKEQLTAKHSFRSLGDNEVILHLFEEEGPSCFNEINGFFALAIWNNVKKELILARDHVGKKPLFYYYNPNEKKIYFSSFLPALIKILDKKPQLNRKALSYYLLLGYIPSPLSIYEHVHKLQPGQYLVFNENSLQVKNIPHNSVSTSASIPEILSTAVSSRTISDIPVGALLSGGVDSTIICHLLKQYTDTNLHAFAVGTEEDEDIIHARLVAKSLDIKYNELLLKENDFKELQSAIYFQSEPIADKSFLPLFLLSKKIKKEGIGVVLTGDGADELFGGYKHHRLNSQKFTKESLFHSLHTFTFGENEIHKMVGSSYNPISFFANQFKNSSNILKSQLQFDFRYYLTDQTLANIDAATMAHALETRNPFLDYRVIQESFKIPTKKLIQQNTAKFYLKEMFKSQIHSQIINREKKGFSLPKHVAESDMYNSLLEQFMHENNYLNISNTLKDEIMSSKSERGKTKKYNMLILALWLEKHMKN